MADTSQASLGADITTEESGVDKARIGDRAIAAAYLTTVGVVMIGWLYVIARTGLAVISWMIFG